MATGSKTTIAATTTQLVAAGERRGIIITNTSSTITVWFKFGSAAVVNEGFKLDPGQAMAFQYSDIRNAPIVMFDTFSMAINGIAESSTADIAYQTL